MQYYTQYSTASVAATLVLVAMCFLKQNYSTKQNKIFRFMVFVNLFVSGTNIGALHSMAHPEDYPLWFDCLINMVYLFSFSMMAVLLLVYIDSIAKIGKYKVAVEMISAVITIVLAIVIFTSQQTKMVVYFDNNMEYHRGAYMKLIYIITAALIVIADVMFMYSSKRFSGYQVFSMNCFILLIYGSVMFQKFYPHHAISALSLSLMMIFLYSAFENPAYFLYKDTRCFNRRAFLATVKKHRKKEIPYVVIAIKIINYDFMRHDLGQSKTENLISRVAEHLNNCYKRKVYNLNDDCFVLILDADTDIKLQRTRLKKLFEEPFEIGDRENTIKLPVSIMVSVIPVENPNIDEKEMEMVVHSVQHDEKEIATAEDIQDVINKLHRQEKLATIIDNAIENDGFEVYYQPIRDVVTGTYPSAEALIRLKDKELGFISPEEFIPIAEKNGRVIEIGDMVFSRVCDFISRSRGMNLGVDYIEVNLSPVQCYHEELARKFLTELGKHDLDPSSVNLEITETAELETRKVKILQRNLDNMNEQGVTFSIDDFGSGFAAIDYLLRLPVTIVKIDKSILWQAMKDQNAMKVLTGTMRMLKEIGKHIVVEGVETEEMATILRENGCDYMQGYLYSKPVPESQYVEFLKTYNVA
ncbi:MAG: EAL domain-containing protein [Lachnospiraceae bacterium]|nr:EAL domain-containing protein [Lachnospiraceae bacterium]